MRYTNKLTDKKIPKILYCKLSFTCPVNINFNDLVNPQPGQGTLNILKMGHTLILRKLKIKAIPAIKKRIIKFFFDIKL